MTMTADTPVHENCIVWLDLGEHITEALVSLRAIEAQEPSERIRGKIDGVEATRAEFRRLEAAGTPHLSLLKQWLVKHLMNPTNYEQRMRGHGYFLVLDYARAY